jgi:ABC-type multidrug transport system fused ATPase/permease subunit
MNLKPHFYNVFKTLNPYNYKELSECKFSNALKYYVFVVFFSVVVMFLLLVPYFYYTGVHISESVAHFDNFTVNSNFQLKESFNLLSDPVIRFDSENVNMTNELVLITPDMISYKRYLIFGELREIPLSGEIDVLGSERVRSLISLGILFILPALFFWAVVFSLVYFGIMILLTYILILIMAGLFRIGSTLLKLLKLCIFASTPFILLQLILMPFFRVFILPLAAYWVLVLIVIFVWHDDTLKDKRHGEGYVFGRNEKKEIFGSHEGSDSASRHKTDVKDQYDVDEKGNIKSSARRHKSVDEENEEYIELK